MLKPLLYYSDRLFMPCYALHILFIWQVVHVTLNRKLRVHFGYLGRFFGPFQAPLRIIFTTIVQFMTDRTRYMNTRSE